MGLLASLAVGALAVLVLAGAYVAVSLAVLLVVEFPDYGPYHLFEDAAFALVLPFVLAVVVAPALRPAKAPT
ncbi:MAG: hypothetical protein ABEI39_06560 [Halobacteriales archaeon]